MGRHYWESKIAHDLPGNHSHSDFTLKYLVRIAFTHIERINIHHSDVGPATRCYYATLFLPKRRVSRPGRVSSYGLFRRHPLFGIPAVRRLQLLVSPCDGRVQSIEDVVIRSDQIGIEDQSRSVAPHRSPRVSAFDAFRPQTIFGPGFVLSAMRRLHRGDHAQLRKALKIVRVNDLRMFYAITDV